MFKKKARDFSENAKGSVTTLACWCTPCPFHAFSACRTIPHARPIQRVSWITFDLAASLVFAVTA